MSQRLEFFFDFASPYSYLAHSQLAGLGAEVVVRPMQVLKVMEAVGNQPTTIQSPAKGRYAFADLTRWAQRYAVPLNPGRTRTNDSAACARAVLAAGRVGQANAATAALFHAFWGAAEPLRTNAEILDALAEAGLDTAKLAPLLDDPSVADELAANTREAAERGVFGAPTIFVGDDMFFGNDRLDFVRERLSQPVAA